MIFLRRIQNVLRREHSSHVESNGSVKESETIHECGILEVAFARSDEVVSLIPDKFSNPHERNSGAENVGQNHYFPDSAASIIEKELSPENKFEILEIVMVEEEEVKHKLEKVEVIEELENRKMCDMDGKAENKLQIEEETKKNEGPKSHDESLVCGFMLVTNVNKEEDKIHSSTCSPKNQESGFICDNVSDSRTEFKSYEINGNRIVNYTQVINDILKKAYDDDGDHVKECAKKRWELSGSTQIGFKTVVYLSCKSCKRTISHHSHPNDDKEMDINKCMVFGSITASSGYSNMQELLAPAGIPCMSGTTYRRHQQDIILDIIGTSERKMKEAGSEERERAVEKGHFIFIAKMDGEIVIVPYITVIADGSWLQRTYPGGAFDSLGGCVVVIGNASKKPLDVIVKCKSCAACERGGEKNKHICYRNFEKTRSSGSMESEATVEAFSNSWEKHGLVYKYLIADGDSSVMSNILNTDPYREFGMTVKKYECISHKLKNHGKQLDAIATKKDPKEKRGDGVLKARKMLAASKMKIRAEILEAANRRRQDTNMLQKDKIRILQDDIMTVPYHVFGDHEKCTEHDGWSCAERKVEGEENHVQLLTEAGVFQKLLDLHRKLAAHAESLLLNTTNNFAEGLNSVICKTNAGKRLNLSQRGSYNARCHIAGLNFATKHAQSDVMNFLDKRVPAAMQKMEDEREIKVVTNRQYDSKKRRTMKHNKKTDKDYGITSQKPDMDPEIYEQQKEILLKGLRENQKNRVAIEDRTKSQSDSIEWNRIRKNMLTASNYGEVCKRRETTFCGALVKRLIYSTHVPGTAAMQYGKEHEHDARKTLQKAIGFVIELSGFWIDPEFEYFGASPDGLIDCELSELTINSKGDIALEEIPSLLYDVDKGGIIEIKCPSRAANLTPEVALQQFKDLRAIYDKKEPDLFMNVNHRYYFQIQGQLHITRRLYCVFTLWTPLGTKTLTVLRNDIFWKERMEPKLVRFYLNCMLPELVDGRHLRHLEIREPYYIFNAKKLKESSRPVKNQQIEESVESEKIEVDEEVSDIGEDEKIEICAEKEICAKREKRSSFRLKNTIEDSNSIKVKLENGNNVFFTQISNAVNTRGSLAAIAFGDIEKSIQLVKTPGAWLDDAALDTFLEILRRNSTYDILSVLSVELPHCVGKVKNDKDIQILGGNCIQHWRCYFYSGNQLVIFDSLYQPCYNSLSEQEKVFIQLRYPELSTRHIKSVTVQKQPDGASCGVYAAAFATSLILGRDPSTERYSSNAMKMRENFANVISRKEITPFPTV